MEWGGRDRYDRHQSRKNNERIRSSLDAASTSLSKSKPPVDKEKLRAAFYPDSDSDDDPIGTIKRRQIAANKRKREEQMIAAQASQQANNNNNAAVSQTSGFKRAAILENNNSSRSSSSSSSSFTTTTSRFATPQNVTKNNNDQCAESKSLEDDGDVIFEREQPVNSDNNATDVALGTDKGGCGVVSVLSSEPSSSKQVLPHPEFDKDPSPTTMIKKNAESSEKEPKQQLLSSENEVATAKEDTDLSSPGNNDNVVHLTLESSSKKSPEAATTTAILPTTTNNAPVESSPIVAKEVKTPKSVSWVSLHSQHLLVRCPVIFNPKEKVAGFDLDSTLVNWNLPPGIFPSHVHQYELWNASVIDKLRKFDKEGYKIVVFSNQGGIKGALQGKIAARVKSVIDWIAKKVGRPVFAVISTMSDSEYHKPRLGMWEIMKSRCNGGVEVRPDLSFFVGDSDGTGTDEYQLRGVDKAFAENVGREKNLQMKFYTPKEFFGVSNVELRNSTLPNDPTPLPRYIVPQRANLERGALMGGYVKQPILLILVGVQGSGKSTFAKCLGQGWCHLSQDTIDNGRPGERKDVEEAAKAMLQQNKTNVVIDRMHLDKQQRQYFIQIGKEAGAHVHCLVFMVSKEEVVRRVKQRTNHPGAVEGERGAKLAVSSLSKLVPPTYDEGLSLINYTYTGDGPILDAYKSIGSNGIRRPLRNSISFYNGDENTGSLQMISLGTFKMKRQDVSSSMSNAIRLGINSIDTAPTYDNETEIGIALRGHTVNVIVKVPKRAIHPNQARTEVMKSLSSLGVKCADVVLLHWPSDLIDANTLLPVWKELESLKKEGVCLAIGVCNFSIAALQKLISICTVKPAMNQVERHPLLPQNDLIDYCISAGVVLQAHSPLGGGKLLMNSTVNKIAEESGMSPAQVLVTWNLLQGIPVVVKSSSPNHLSEIAALLHENTDNLALSAVHMKELSEMSLSPGFATQRFVAPPFMFRPGALYSWEEDKLHNGDYIDPVVPNKQFSIGSGEEKLSVVLYMAIREKKSSLFSEGLALCEANCPPNVQSHCFQRDGTRHITLYQGELSKTQARMLRYKQDQTDVDISLPLNIDFDGWMSWDAGCYLSVERNSRRSLESLLDKVVGLPHGFPQKCDHLSLYRNRKFPGHDFRLACNKIKQATLNQRWGSVEGVSIRLKIMQGDYEDCIVLAGE